MMAVSASLMQRLVGSVVTGVSGTWTIVLNARGDLQTGVNIRISA